MIRIYYVETKSYWQDELGTGSFVDFHVQKVVNLPELIKLAGGLELKFFNYTDCMIVRLFERDTL